LTFSRQEVERMRNLAAEGTVNARDLALAEQQLALAKADIDRVHAAQAEARNQVAGASGATESKMVAATRAVLVSSFDGMVVRRLKDPGDDGSFDDPAGPLGAAIKRLARPPSTVSDRRRTAWGRRRERRARGLRHGKRP
jgi:hypothetical protein